MPADLGNGGAFTPGVAPDLLAALEKICDLTKPGQTVNISQATYIICDVWNEARAALSKATTDSRASANERGE